MLDDPCPPALDATRLIAPGQSVALPEVHFGLNHDAFDATIQASHRHLRLFVPLLPLPRRTLRASA